MFHKYKLLAKLQAELADSSHFPKSKATKNATSISVWHARNIINRL